MIPAEVLAVLAGTPAPGIEEQAFTFLTVDEAGFPHVCLLSRTEIDADEGGIRVAVASTGTSANLERDGQACLVVVEGTTAHYVKLRVTGTAEAEGRLVAALEAVGHRADSLGIPLAPIRFTPTAAIAELEGWDATRRALASFSGSSGS